MNNSARERIVLLLFALSGLAALTYEVIWARALSFVIGSTIYSTSTIFSAFLGGLALGSYLGGRVSKRINNLLFFIAGLETGIALFGIMTVPVIYKLPPMYFAFFRQFHLTPGLFFFLQLFFSWALMLIPTMLMGATFPAIALLLTERLQVLGRRVGYAYAVNTIGGLIGSVLSGIVLIPLLGLKGASLTAAGVNLSVGFAFMIMSGKRARAVVVLPMSAVLVVAVIVGTTARYDNYYANFYRAGYHRSYEELRREQMTQKEIFYGEYAEGSVRAYRDDLGFLFLQVGGRVEGTPAGEVPSAMLPSYLPIAAHNTGAEKALVIGLGSGWTLKAAKRYVRRVDVVEINPGVIDVVRQFGQEDLLDGVGVTADDGRRFLTLRDEQYDMITSIPSYPTNSAVAGLFTKDFYEIAAERLRKGGIYSQWLPTWMLKRKEGLMMIKTFGSVFDDVRVFQLPGWYDLVLVGSKEPIGKSDEEIIELVKGYEWEDFSAEYSVFMGADEVREVVAREDIPVNTDDMPYLEFAVIRNFLRGLM